MSTKQTRRDSNDLEKKQIQITKEVRDHLWELKQSSQDTYDAVLRRELEI